MLTSARVLNTWSGFSTRKLQIIINLIFSHSLSIDWICRWLYTPRDDGKPRILVHYYVTNYEKLVDRIKKVENCEMFQK
jgi:hypothetical protein